jgi:hypothetical protein
MPRSASFLEAATHDLSTWRWALKARRLLRTAVGNSARRRKRPAEV